MPILPWDPQRLEPPVDGRLGAGGFLPVADDDPWIPGQGLGCFLQVPALPEGPENIIVPGHLFGNADQPKIHQSPEFLGLETGLPTGLPVEKDHLVRERGPVPFPDEIFPKLSELKGCLPAVLVEMKGDDVTAPTEMVCHFEDAAAGVGEPGGQEVGVELLGKKTPREEVIQGLEPLQECGFPIDLSRKRTVSGIGIHLGGGSAFVVFKAGLLEEVYDPAFDQAKLG
jgi:hypothetical protein